MHPETTAPPGDSRRGFVSWILMFVGIAGGYGLGALHFFRYLVPLRRERKRREMFIGTLDALPLGATRTVRDPAGQEIIIARVADSPGHPPGDFQALSTKCPHLGCKVHWEAGKDRFRCPCHEGIFDKNGKAIAGPPAQEGKNLLRYEVRVNSKSRSVFVMVAAESAHGA